MSIWRGIQSAIFFYVSCAPCYDASTRKQRKRQAVHDSRMRTELEAEHPNYPAQAAPGSVNPNWLVEIESGPRIPRKSSKILEEGINRTRSRDLNRAESRRGLNLVSRRDSKRELKPSTTQSTTSSQKGQSATDLPHMKRQQMIYQRPDEELWGAPSSSTVNLPTRPGTARTKSATTPYSYIPARHPAVNDYHPPTTRKCAGPEEVAWMLQPLPSAAVMVGKEVPTTPPSRSNSDASKQSPKSSKSMPTTPLTPIKASQGSEDTIIHIQDPKRVLRQPEEWIWETTGRNVSSRRSLEW